MMNSLGMAKYQAGKPRVEIPLGIDNPSMLINEVARLAFEYGVRHYDLSAEDLVYNWGRETQKLLTEERDQLEADLDELLRTKAPIDRIRNNLQLWANNVLELYRRYQQYRLQQSCRKQVA